MIIMSDNGSNRSGNISNRDELTAQLESSFKRQQCGTFADEWVLPDDLAFYSNKHLQKFIEGKRLKGWYIE